MIYTVSNMWPRYTGDFYGAFVERIHMSLSQSKSVIRLGSGKRKLYLHLQFFLHQLIIYSRAKKDDIFFIHFVTRSGFGILLSRILFKSNAKIVLFFHGSDVMFDMNSFAGKFWKSFVVLFLKNCDYVCVPSAYLKSFIIEHYNFYKIIVTPSGGISNEFQLNKNILKRKYTFGYIGRISESKGTFNSLKAIMEIDDGESQYDILLVGPCSEKQKLDYYLNQKKLNITYLGALPHNDLPKYYNQIKYFLYPTKKDSLGLVGLEAMRSGCILFTLENSAPADYVEHGITGFVAKDCSIFPLSFSIKEMLSWDDAVASRISSSASHHASKFNSEVVAKELNTCLGLIVKGECDV